MTAEQPGNGVTTDARIRASAAYQKLVDRLDKFEEKAAERHSETMGALIQLNSNPAVAIGRLFQGGYKSLVAIAALSGVVWLITGSQQLWQNFKQALHLH